MKVITKGIFCSKSKSETISELNETFYEKWARTFFTAIINTT